MSVGDDGGGKTAEELLFALLTERERIMVLEYAIAHNLESDDAVFFMVALLKIFAHVNDRMLATVATAEQGRRDIEYATKVAVGRIDAVLTTKFAAVERVATDVTERMAFHTSEIRGATGEMKILREQLAGTVTDTREAFAAYEHLKGNVKVPTLSRLFHDRMLAALDKRVPVYDQVFRQQMLETISLGMGRYFVIVQAELIGLAMLAGLILYVLK